MVDSSKLNELENRLQSIEQRLEDLEKNPQAKDKNNQQNREKESSAPSPVTNFKSSENVGPTTQSLDKRPSSPNMGYWLGTVAIVCFLVAVVFIIKLSIDSGWLTPSRQIGIAGLFGVGLIASGLVLVKTDRKYASYLPAAGIVVLHMCVFGAHNLHFLVGFKISLLAIALISVICVLLYGHLKENIYAITSTLGIYVSPLLLGPEGQSTLIIYYYLISSLALNYIAIYMDSRLITLISAYASVLLTTKIGIESENNALISIALATHFIIFSFGTFFHSIKWQKPLKTNEACTFFPVLFFFYIFEFTFINKLFPGMAPWFSLGFAGLLLGLYFISKKQLKNQNSSTGPVIITFVSLVLFHSVYVELLPIFARPWILVFILIFYALIPEKKFMQKAFIPSYFCLVPIILIESTSIIKHLLTEHESGVHWIIVATATTASLWSLRFLKFSATSKRPEYGEIVLYLAHFFAIVTLYSLTQFLELGSLSITISWLSYSLAIIALSFPTRDKAIAKSTTFVLLFAAGKALLYDAASAPTGVRIMCLLITGGVLYTSGLFLRKISYWE